MIPSMGNCLTFVEVYLDGFFMQLRSMNKLDRPRFGKNKQENNYGKAKTK